MTECMKPSTVNFCILSTLPEGLIGMVSLKTICRQPLVFMSHNKVICFWDSDILWIQLYLATPFIQLQAVLKIPINKFLSMYS